MTLTIQFYTLLAMIGMGSCFGAALDTYNRFLKRSVRKRWIVFLHDFLFWIIQGLLIFYVLFLVNEGEFRLYLFLALLCGFSAYQALFKGVYQRFLEFLILLVIKVVRFLTKSVQMLIFLPIKWVIVTAISIIIGIGRFVLVLIKMDRENNSLYFKCFLETFKMDTNKDMEFIAGFCYKKRREVL